MINNLTEQCLAKLAFLSLAADVAQFAKKIIDIYKQYIKHIIDRTVCFHFKNINKYIHDLKGNINISMKITSLTPKVSSLKLQTPEPVGNTLGTY